MLRSRARSHRARNANKLDQKLVKRPELVSLLVQVIVTERGPLVWVFNFSPTRDYEGLKARFIAPWNARKASQAPTWSAAYYAAMHHEALNAQQCCMGWEGEVPQALGTPPQERLPRQYSLRDHYTDVFGRHSRPCAQPCRWVLARAAGTGWCWTRTRVDSAATAASAMAWTTSRSQRVSQVRF